MVLVSQMLILIYVALAHHIRQREQREVDES